MERGYQVDSVYIDFSYLILLLVKLNKNKKKLILHYGI